MLLFQEIHIDDWFPDRRDKPGYVAARDLVERLLGIAEARGQRLALRVRHGFAEAARAHEGADNALVRWEERGHEIGLHAHRRRVRRTWRALRAAGVQRLEAAVPGLIQSSRREALRTLAACRGLGLRYLSDQLQDGGFAYTGLTPWRPAPDLRGPGGGPFVFIDVSVNPFHWGLLEQHGAEVRHRFGLRERHYRQLEALLDAQLAAPAPHPVTYFGVPFHEHNHARALGDIRPDEDSLAAYDAHLGRLAERPVTPCLPRDVYAAWVAIEGAPPPDERVSILREFDQRDLILDTRSKLTQRLSPDLSPLLSPLAPLRQARARLAWERRRWPALRRERAAGGQRRRLRVGDREIEVCRFGPPEAEAALVLSHAGRFGGLTTGLQPFGLRPEDLPRFAIWAWDRSGTGATRGDGPLAPGQARHAEEAAAVWDLAAAEGCPTGWLSFSAGLVAPLLALPETDPAFFVDGEGPADRRSLSWRPPGGLLRHPLGAELAHLSKLDDAAWAGREPWRLIAGLRAPYHRLQAALDHAHGEMVLHARVMLEAAPGAPTLNGRPWDGQLKVLPGRLQAHGPKVRDMLTHLLLGPTATR
ncbi:MAG: hypothetical protein H6741_26970 [Alphaproteobacteria bacterium]|nr:hypothetical protein [Alphaproteobacteria bacterium]MCB9796354.1 hypothetical protein [Alphaproteobacteria bacterium]